MRFYHWSAAPRRRVIQGFHLAADPICCGALTELLNLLRENPSPRGQKTVCDTSLRKIREFHSGAQVGALQSFAEFRLMHDPGLAAEVSMQSNAITLSTQGLDIFQEGLDSMQQGGGDWAMFDIDEQALWFWWWT